MDFLPGASLQWALRNMNKSKRNQLIEALSVLPIGGPGLGTMRQLGKYSLGEGRTIMAGGKQLERFGPRLSPSPQKSVARKKRIAEKKEARKPRRGIPTGLSAQADARRKLDRP